jgi:phenylacetate-CoA ligase
VKKDDVFLDQQARPPFGTMLTCPSRELRRIHCVASSVYMLLNSYDLGYLGRVFADQFRVLGVRKTDIVDIASTFHWVMAGTLMEAGLRKIGCVMVPGGPGSSDLRLKVMKEVGVSVLQAFTPYAEVLAVEMREREISPADLKLRLLVIGGELRTADAKARLSDAWGGAAIRELYGASEVGLAAAECFEVGDGMHISEHCVIELVDPDTGLEVDPAGPGEIVVTDLYRRAQPFIRFRTGDLTEGINFEPCACGRTSPRLGRILGRRSDIVRVRGLFVHPQRVLDVLKRYPEVGRHQIVVDRPGVTDRLTIRVERGAYEQSAGLAGLLQKDLQSSIGLLCDVEFVPPGTVFENGQIINDVRAL